MGEYRKDDFVCQRNLHEIYIQKRQDMKEVSCPGNTAHLYSNIPNRGRQVVRYSRFGITIGGYSFKYKVRGEIIGAAH